MGGGLADDHLNVAVASDGTLYAAVKTSYDRSNTSKIGLLVRQPDGVWEGLYHVDNSGTRPIVVLSEAQNKVVVAYTGSEGGDDILYRETALDQISFGPTQVLISGNTNDVTTTKDPFINEVVVLSSRGGTAYGVLLAYNAPSTQGLEVDAGSNQTIQLGDAANLFASIEGDAISLDWSVVSGPGNVVFSDPNSASTAAGFSEAGTYVLRLTAIGDFSVESDEVTIVVADLVQNQAPVTERRQQPTNHGWHAGSTEWHGNRRRPARPNHGQLVARLGPQCRIVRQCQLGQHDGPVQPGRHVRAAIDWQ